MKSRTTPRSRHARHVNCIPCLSVRLKVDPKLRGALPSATAMLYHLCGFLARFILGATATDEAVALRSKEMYEYQRKDGRALGAGLAALPFEARDSGQLTSATATITTRTCS